MNVGCKGEIGESIIQDVKGVSVVIQRSLRDLLHQIPNVEVAIKVMHHIFIGWCCEIKALLIALQY